MGLSPGSGRSLGKEVATHSSILAWRIPWTKKLGGLQSMGSQRVRHNLATKPPPPCNLNPSQNLSKSFFFFFFKNLTS